MSTLHEQAIVIDGLIISNFARAVFEDMRKGGLTAANCTCSVWEDFQRHDRTISPSMKQLIRDNADLMRRCARSPTSRAPRKTARPASFSASRTSRPSRTTSATSKPSRTAASASRRWPTTRRTSSAPAATSATAACPDFGHEVDRRDEPRRHHVSICRTSARRPPTTVIRASKKPVCYSHSCPTGLKKHPRNKSDEQIALHRRARRLRRRHHVPAVPASAARLHRRRLRRGASTTSSTSPARTASASAPTSRKTRTRASSTGSRTTRAAHRQLDRLRPIVNPDGIRTIGEFPNLTAAMEKAGWTESAHPQGDGRELGQRVQGSLGRMTPAFAHPLPGPWIYTQSH